MQLNPGWMNTKDVARLSPHLTPDDVTYACRKGELKNEKVGRSYKIREKAALAWVKKTEKARG
jgi:hypothetical protein